MKKPSTKKPAPRKKVSPTLPVLDELMRPIMTGKLQKAKPKPRRKPQAPTGQGRATTEPTEPLVKDGELTARGKAAHKAVSEAIKAPVKKAEPTVVVPTPEHYDEQLANHLALQPPPGLTKKQMAEFDRARSVGAKEIMKRKAEAFPPSSSIDVPKIAKADRPPIPDLCTTAIDLIPPRTPEERVTVIRAAKLAYDYHKTYGFKPAVLELFEQYKQTHQGEESNMATKKTTNKKATSTKKSSTPAAPKAELKTLKNGELEAAVRKVAKDLKPIRVMATVAALRKIGVATTGEAIVKTVMAIREERGEPNPKSSKFASLYSKAAPAPTKKATPAVAKRAEGNGSLKRDKVTPIPKKSTAKKAAAVAQKRSAKPTKRVSKKVPTRGRR